MRLLFLHYVKFLSSILIHAPARDATSVAVVPIDGQYFNPRTREGCDIILIISCYYYNILIHAPARDATAKSYKIGNNFAALFRKFIQKLGIVTFHISIFLEKQEQYFLFL